MFPYLSWILFTLFLIYHQPILSYILTLALRIGLRIGLVKVVNKRKKNQQYQNQEEWRIKTNIISFFSFKEKLPSPFLKCNYKLNAYDANTNSTNTNSCDNSNHENENEIIEESNDQEEEEEIITPNNISVVAAIPSCRIGSTSLSLFVYGQVETRTFLLALIIEQFIFKLCVTLKINANADTNMRTNMNNSQKAETKKKQETKSLLENNNMEYTTRTHTRTRTKLKNRKKETTLDIEFTLSIKTIKFYLFSIGLILVIARKLHDMLDKKRKSSTTTEQAQASTSIPVKTEGSSSASVSIPVESAEPVSASIPVEIPSALAKSKKLQKCFYIITKIIGGLDIDDFHIGLTMVGSSRKSHDAITNVNDNTNDDDDDDVNAMIETCNHNYKAAVHLKKVIITLENKHVDVPSTEEQSNNEQLQQQQQQQQQQSKSFCMGVELSSFKVSLTNNNGSYDQREDTVEQDHNHIDQESTSITLEKGSVSFVLSDTSTAQIEISSRDKPPIEINVLTSEVMNVMKMILKFLLPTINGVKNMNKSINIDTATATATSRDTDEGNVIANGTRSKNNCDSKPKIILKKISIYTAIKLILIDDGDDEIQMQWGNNFGRRLELGLDVSVEKENLSLPQITDDDINTATNTNLEGNNELLSKDILSVVMTNFYLKHCGDREQESIGTFKVSLNTATLLIEKDSEQTDGVDIFIDLGSFSVMCDHARENDYLIILGILFHSSLNQILPRKKPKRKKKKSSNPMNCLAIACKSVDLSLNMFCRDTNTSLQTDVKLRKLFLSLTPPDIVQNGQEQPDGLVIVQLTNIVSSVSFVPHQTLSSFDDCIQRVTSSAPCDMKDGFEYQQKRVKYVLSGENFKLDAVLPSKISNAELVDLSEEQSLLEIEMSNTILKEEVESISPDNTILTHYLLRFKECIHFALCNSIMLATDGSPHSMQSIQIQTLNGGVLMLQWSPITQWFITSAVKQILHAIQYYTSLTNRDTENLSPKKETKPMNVSIVSNDTMIKVTAFLGGASICNVLTKDLAVNVTHNVDDTWKNPDVTCDTGETSVNFANDDFDVVKVSSFRFSDIIRRASSQEISTYCKKKNDQDRNFDEIVTGTCGIPLLERFELTFGDSTKVDLPPLLHLGKFIEDITLTERCVKEGLIASGIIRRKRPSKIKYQLMDIHFNVPMLDANFFETSSSHHLKNFRSIKFGIDSHNSLLNRWRFHIKNVSVLIKRNTPPEIIQEQLRCLDEDKHRKYSYGPKIQGGNFDLNISHVACVLHPLNMTLPLGDIKELKLSGLIYLAALNPDTKGLKSKEEICVPVKCHHTASNCRCDYGVILESCLSPVKIYYDVKLSSAEIHSNYGPILNESIPRLMSIIQRLQPSPPFIDKRYELPTHTSAPLTPWDNMRHQFHGKFSWTMKKVSFRWLLDIVPNYDWSILLTTKDLNLHHSLGVFKLDLADTIVSIPHSSYHLLHFDKNAPHFLKERTQVNSGDGTSNRHSLLLVPCLSIDFGLCWQVPFPELNQCTRHHIPYLVDTDGWPQLICSEDRFKYFRSESVKMHLKIKLKQTSQFSNWVALRADVLPWLTHKCPSLAQEEKVEDPSEPKLKIDGIQIDVIVSELRIGAWFDERVDFLSNEDDILEGIYITIPQVQYTLDDLGKNRIDLNGIQAALLDIDCRTFSKPLGYQIYKYHWTSTKWKNVYNPFEYENLNNVNSFRIFESLHYASKKIRTLDYLLKVDNINVLDKSLEEILSSCSDMSSSVYSTNDKLVQKEKAPWTVLVAEMKLLWTVEIRDRVFSIVKDILFAINFMKVNARGTPQLLQEKGDCEMNDKVCLDQDLNRSKEFVINAPKNSEVMLCSTISEDVAFETAISEAGTKVSVVGLHDDKLPKGKRTESNKPKSHLDHLLLDTAAPDRSHKILSPTGDNEVDETAKLTTMTFEPNIDIISTIAESYSYNKDNGDDTIPTFDLQLSNPQIQFHSEKTGGSVIISMRGAYIEMKMYSHLFCKEEDLDRQDLRVETLLRRTEFLYTLDRMELYSLSNSVDMDIGLQWLETKGASDKCRYDDTSSNKTQKLRNFMKLNNFETENSAFHDEKMPDRNGKSFPPDLQQHETKMFTLPLLCKKIMDPCTFTTLQTFHRPPIDLTKEELAETIEKKLILSLTTTNTDDIKSSRAIDHVEIHIDELSFLLDSHQFNTTLDVVRNVLLEPPKPDRERYYNISEEETKDRKEQQVNARKNEKEKSDAAKKMEEAIRQWDDRAYQKSKKGREYLRGIANDLIAEVEEKQADAEPSIRRIEYTLCKAKWKMASPDIINDAEISFTRFKGVHDFSADGSVNSLITLEDIYVESTKPGSESLDFFDPTTIIKTVIGVERSPCCRCGLSFDRTTNESNSCKYHPGSFNIVPGEQISGWTCCNSLWEKAPGCRAQPHTGLERAVSVRMDAFPRTVEGLTMYKHIEGNIYPGVPHTIIVQLTNSLTKSFSKYFLGEGGKDDILDEHKLILHSESSAPKRRTYSDSSSETLDATMNTEMNTGFSPHSSKTNKKVLFGMMRRKEPLNKKKAKESALSVERLEEPNPNSTPSKENKEETVKQNREIVFVKYWRVGGININLSITGFRWIVKLSNEGVVVPYFRKAYKIGSSQHLINKLLRHFLASLVSNGMEILYSKMKGRNQKYNGTEAILSECIESDDEEEEAPDQLIPQASAVSKKKKKSSGGIRKRLYTK